MKSIIEAKKQGKTLTAEQIQFFVDGVTNKTIPEYQTSALLMAIYFKGMTIEERSLLTRAMANSGDVMNHHGLSGFIVDKHSTGGVGDKTSLILAPLMAACGLKVPMVSGRGLGFTGGTLDKLEGIPGYQTRLDFAQMSAALHEVGCFIAGQTGKVAPADGIIYSLRDVTQTVDEISLITASILSKKFTEGLHGLVLDVKCGSGAFMKSQSEAEALAESLVHTTRGADIACTALITDMTFPLGIFTGNTCETLEALYYMKPDSDYFELFKEKIKVAESRLVFKEIESPREDLLYVTTALAAYMLKMNNLSLAEALKLIEKKWQDGSMYNKFAEMVSNQQGDLSAFEEKAAKIQNAYQEGSNVFTYRAERGGYLSAVDSEAIGNLMVELGAGRKVASDAVNHAVSLRVDCWQNQQVEKGQALFSIYHDQQSVFEQVDINQALSAAVTIATKPQQDNSLILKVLD